MKNIGIITFHCVENYGAFLQTYASIQILKGIKGTNVSVINYRPSFLTDQDKINFFAWTSERSSLICNLKKVLLYSITVPNRVQRKIRFYFARKRYFVSGKPFRNRSEYCGPRYDYLYLGSDQIWNPEITKGLDPVYFGDLPNCEKTIKFSYAASFGGASYSNKEIDIAQSYLRQLRYIGIRERSDENFVREISAKNPHTVLDPVLLVNPQVWFDQTKKRLLKEQYILVYQLRQTPTLFAQAAKFAQQHNFRIIHLGDPTLRQEGIKSVSFAGPFEFINYIRFAEAVFTDSFHATCFSLIFKKEFYTFLHKTRSSRLIDLGNDLGFSDRLVGWNEEAVFSTCDKLYDVLDLKLEQEKANSFEFLRIAMQSS